MHAEEKQNRTQDSSSIKDLDTFTFHQRLMQDPEQLDEALLAYLMAHPEQKQKVQKARKMNQQLKETLNSVPVPERLADKILLQTVPSENTVIGCLKTVVTLSWHNLQKAIRGIQSKLAREKVYWVAGSAIASFILIVVLMPQPLSWNDHRQKAEIEQAVVTHVQRHPEELIHASQKVSEKQLRAELSAYGASLAQPMDFVTHVSDCRIGGIKGLHLVIQSFSGPVTVIMLPKVTVSEMEAFKQSGFQGALVPVKGATLAIVGNNLTQIGWAQMVMLDHVHFGVKAKSSL